ncbi:hypothetical protein SISNIDRAFT_548241 [Sistotremastrum niveocremeum HHB9708]|uniref:Beta-trefoil n=1 Tax=Sistotremastrum niveocremeum HHB9708 TaxID=1314777 RepID=A0A164XNB4_9AGAM|nr:hypothetical protein SISNIDRAFT_548241 [Sistotremastrum niveocremeum HHB9708]
MRVVLDAFQTYINELQSQVLTPSMNPPSTSDLASTSANPNHHNEHDHHRPPTPSQTNLDLLLNAINANPPSSDPARTRPGPPHPNTGHLDALVSRGPNTNTAMSIQSLLAVSDHSVLNHQGHHSSWPSAPPPEAISEGAGPSHYSNKRKLDDMDAEESQAKIRRTVREHLVMDSARVMSMTTVVCLHAAVAQKSYGSEKRFLCPPPIVRIEGPNQQLKHQQLTMSIVHESGDRSAPQKAPLDNSMQAAFKHLHVANTAKEKSFFLALDIADPPPPPGPSMSNTEAQEIPGRVWASFESAPVTIISKPSKKTAKTRNISSCILAGGPVSLFNRINSQTVRTKYMTIDHAALCASNISWSAFNVNVVRRPPEPPSTMTGPQPVTYGCEIVLADSLSGIATCPLTIRKVDKGRVSTEDGGPVSQMQKIALQRVSADGTRQYLSAAGPLTGAGGIVAPTPGNTGQGGTHPLMFQAPRVRDEMKDGVRVVTDEVDDYLCWTIVGISKFQYTFFDAFGKNLSSPAFPVTPFPTLFTTPVYRQSTHTLELTVSNFYYPSPDGRGFLPLEVWLGNIGPLTQRVFQATPPGPLTSVSPFGHQGSTNHGPSSPSGFHTTQQSVAEGHLSAETPAHSPASESPHPNLGPLQSIHSVVILDMPPMEQIVRSMQETIESHGRSPEAGSDAVGRDSEDEVAKNLDPGAEKNDGSSSPRSQHRSNGPPPTNGRAAASINGRSLPLLFIRGVDGMGYHSGRSITCENLIHSLTLNALNGSGNVDTGWIAAAAAADGSYNGAWNLRVT